MLPFSSTIDINKVPARVRTKTTLEKLTAAIIPNPLQEMKGRSVGKINHDKSQ